MILLLKGRSSSQGQFWGTGAKTPSAHSDDHQSSLVESLDVLKPQRLGWIFGFWCLQGMLFDLSSSCTNALFRGHADQTSCPHCSTGIPCFRIWCALWGILQETQPLPSYGLHKQVASGNLESGHTVTGNRSNTNCLPYENHHS